MQDPESVIQQIPLELMFSLVAMGCAVLLQVEATGGVCRVPWASAFVAFLLEIPGERGFGCPLFHLWVLLL